ncbi:MAG: hypothetical protein ACXWV2_05840 [Chitinophagaceae bacterium]
MELVHVYDKSGVKEMNGNTNFQIMEMLREYESALDKFKASHKESAPRMKEMVQDNTSLILYPARY